MADTAKRIGPYSPGTGATTRYTVPGSTAFHLLCIRVQNPSSSAVPWTLSIGADASDKRLFDAESIPAQGSIDWNGFIPMVAAEILQDLAGSAATLVVTMGGVEVT